MKNLKRNGFLIMVLAMTSTLFLACTENQETNNTERALINSNNRATSNINSRDIRIESSWTSPSIISQYQSKFQSLYGMSGLTQLHKNTGAIYTTWFPEFFGPSPIYYRKDANSSWEDITPITPLNSNFYSLYSNAMNDFVFSIWQGSSGCFISNYSGATGWSSETSCGLDEMGMAKVFTNGNSRDDGSFHGFFTGSASDGSKLLYGATFKPGVGWFAISSLPTPSVGVVEPFVHRVYTSELSQGRTMVIWKQGYYTDPNEVLGATYSEASGWSIISTLSPASVSSDSQILLSTNPVTGTATLVIAPTRMGGLIVDNSYRLSFNGSTWSIPVEIAIGRKLSYASNKNGDMLVAWIRETSNAGFGNPLFNVEVKMFSETSGWQPTTVVKQPTIISLSTIPKVSINASGDAIVGWVERSTVNELIVRQFSKDTNWGTPELIKTSNTNSRIGDNFSLTYDKDRISVMWDEAETNAGQVTRTMYMAHHQGNGQAVQPGPVQTNPLPDITSNPIVSDKWSNAQQVWRAQPDAQNYTGVFGPKIHIDESNTPIISYQEYTGSPFASGQLLKTHAMTFTNGTWINNSPIPIEMENNVRFSDLKYFSDSITGVSYAAWTTIDGRLYATSRSNNAPWSNATLIMTSTIKPRLLGIYQHKEGIRLIWESEKTLATTVFSGVNGLSTEISSISLSASRSVFQSTSSSLGRYFVALVDRQNPLSNAGMSFSMAEYQEGVGWSFNSQKIDANNISPLGFYSTQQGGAVLLGKINIVPIELTGKIISDGPLLSALYLPTKGWQSFTAIDNSLINIKSLMSVPHVVHGNSDELHMVWSSQITEAQSSIHSVLYSQLADNGAGELSWSSPISIGQTSHLHFETRPKLVIADSGNLMALWVDNSVNESALWTNRFTQGIGWQAIAEKSVRYSVPNEGYIIDFDISEKRNNVFLSWKHLETNTAQSSFSILESETLF